MPDTTRRADDPGDDTCVHCGCPVRAHDPYCGCEQCGCEHTDMWWNE